MQVSGPVKEDTVTGPKIAAVERREARVPGNNGTGHLLKVPVCYRSADPALRSLAHARGKKKEAPPRASLTIGVDGARLQETDGSGGCDNARRATAASQRHGRARSRAPAGCA